MDDAAVLQTFSEVFFCIHDIVEAVSRAWKNTLTPFSLLPVWLAAGEEWKQGDAPSLSLPLLPTVSLQCLCLL